jgi:predicted Zn-dependent protease
MKHGSALPPPACFHVSSAWGWLELGDLREARLELAALSAAEQSHPDALETWWKIFAEEEDWRAALECAERAVVSAPEHASGWIHRSFALHELRRTREAFECLQGVVGKFPEEFVIPYNLACYQCQLGDEAAAWTWLKKAAKAGDPRRIRAMALDDPDLAPLREKLPRLM